MSIQVDGAAELVGRLEQIAKCERVKQNLNDACLLVERSAKEKCPSKTGELRSSIAATVNDFQGEIGTPLQYGIYVEYGTGLFAAEGNGRTNVPWRYQDAQGEWHITSGQPPQPFLIPALNENRAEIIEKLQEGILDG